MVEGNAKRGPLTAALARCFIEAMSTTTGTLREREETGLALANELLRGWLQHELARMAKQYGAEVLVDGQRFKRHSVGTARYHSLCGSVEVRRDLYRQVGVHNGPTVVPLELEAGILENATPALAASVVQGFAAMPLRLYEQEMAAAHRRIPSRSSLERIGKRIGKQIADLLPRIEPMLRARATVPEEARSISIGVDRTTVPMAEETGEEARPRRGRARSRPRPVIVAYRMAYIATLAVHDRRGEELSTVRLAATAEEGATVLMERLAAELEHLRLQRPKIPVVVVQDGAPELWSLVDECLANLGVTPALRLIDRYHLEARLAEVAEVVTKTPAAARTLLARWRACLDRTDATLARICGSLERKVSGRFVDDYQPWPTEPPTLHGWRAIVVNRHLGYLFNCRDRSRYASARRRGYPIGSGITEGACKSVIAARFKRSGQRWREPGASRCLLLRSILLNDRLTPAFELLLAERQRALRT